MKLEKLEEIKLLIDTANKLKNLVSDYKLTISDKNCDKHDLKFGGDERFSVFNAQVFLDCHAGYYGSSGCSTFRNINNKQAVAFLNKALNKNMELILADMAYFAQEEALKLRGEAEAEINYAKRMLDSIQKQVSDEQEKFK